MVSLVKKKGEQNQYEIAIASKKEWFYSFYIFTATILLVVGVYLFFGKFTHWTSYVDTFVTGIFFAGMWLMARRKIENWLFWIIGDIISIPMYFVKGYTFTSIQYLIFTIIAFYGYQEWKKKLQQ